MGLEVYFRYADDEGMVVRALQPGTRFVGDNVEVIEEEVEADEDIPVDKRTAMVYRQIANTILACIQVEEDVPSNHLSKKIPVLDLEVWVEGDEIKHEFYRKPVANTRLVMNRSALSTGSKRVILTEECLRRMRNCSINLPWQEKAKHLNVFSLDMKESGYPEGYRKGILSRSIRRYEAEVKSHEDWERGEEGGRPNFRSGEERRMKKKEKEGNATSDNWFRGGRQGYTSTVLVPASSGGEIFVKMKEEMDASRAPKGTKVKVIESGGRAASNSLMRTNSYPRDNCGRGKCQLCWQEGRKGEAGSGGRCYSGYFGYSATCSRCPEEDREAGLEDNEVRRAVYHGESARTTKNVRVIFAKY